jgi:hypothetical protein
LFFQKAIGTSFYDLQTHEDDVSDAVDFARDVVDFSGFGFERIISATPADEVSLLFFLIAVRMLRLISKNEIICFDYWDLNTN